MAFVNEREKRRVVDYERDAVMTKGGAKHITRTPRDPQVSFVINWGGREIEFIADEYFQSKRKTGSNAIMKYVVSKCYYEPALRPFRDEIIAMVTEALQTYGLSYGTDDDTEIIVKIDPGIGALNPDYKFEDQPEDPTQH